MRILILQSLYDQIGRRLTQHHKGHKGISDFPALKASLERNARITADGVEVDLARLKIVADAIQDNIRFAAGRYATAPDRMLLLDIADAIAEHEANLASPAPEECPEGASATEEPQPVQSLQQDDAQRSDALAALGEVATGQATPRPYVGIGRLAGRINGAVRGAPVQDVAAKAPATRKANLGPPPEGTFWAWDGCDDFEAMPELRFAQID